MRPVDPNFVALRCHPDTRCEAVQAIAARVQRIPDGRLAIAFCLDADIDRLRTPPLLTQRRADRLWLHTCFETFVALKREPGYCELNFAPSGEWAAYTFRRYRDGAPLESDLEPEISVRRTPDRLELDAVIRLDCLPQMQPHAPLRLALSTVVEDEHGKLSYWALRHPSGKPDFHHPDAFALDLDPHGEDIVNDPARQASR